YFSFAFPDDLAECSGHPKPEAAWGGRRTYLLAGVGGVMIQGPQQRARCRSRRNIAAQDRFPAFFAVHGGVAGLVGLDHIAIEADAGEGAAAAGIGQDFGVHGGVGGGCGLTADRTGGGIRIRADAHLISEEMIETVAGAEHHDDVGGLSAKLQAPTAAANLDEDRRAPAIAIAASGQAFAVGAAEAEGE